MVPPWLAVRSPAAVHTPPRRCTPRHLPASVTPQRDTYTATHLTGIRPTTKSWPSRTGPGVADFLGALASVVVFLVARQLELVTASPIPGGGGWMTSSSERVNEAH